MAPLTRNRAAWLVALLTLAALGLRLRGVGFQLPHYAQTDGLPTVERVVRQRAGEPDPPSYGDWAPAYGHLLPDLVGLIPDRSEPAVRVPRTLDQHARRHAVHWIDVRLVSALCSVLIVPGTYLLARRFLSRAGALFAAALPATSLVHTSLSQMERPHGIAASTALLAVLAALHLRRRPTVPAHLLLGLAAGLAVGALQSGVAVLIPAAVAWLLRRRQRSASRWWAVAALLATAACLRRFYPFLFRSGESTRPPGDERLRLGGHGFSLEEFDGSGAARILATLVSYDPLILALLVFGGAWLLATRTRRAPLDDERRRDLLVVLSYALPYAAVLALFANTYERFVLQLLPYLGLVGGLVLDRLRAGPNPALGRLAPGLGAALLVFPAANAWHLGTVRSAPDTATLAAGWLLDHAAPDERVDVLPYLDLPLLIGPRALAFDLNRSTRTPWIDYQGRLEPAEFAGPRLEVFRPPRFEPARRQLEHPRARYRDLGTDWLVLQQVGPNYRYRPLPELREQLRAESVPVVRFSPLLRDAGESGQMDTRYQQPVLRRPFFVHLWRCARMGTTIEVYDLRDAAPPDR